MLFHATESYLSVRVNCIPRPSGPGGRRLFEDWLPGSGETVAERPCMELYRNTPADTAATHLITDLCMPLVEPEVR